MIELTLLDTDGDCNSTGPVCYGCPLYDGCDMHYDEDES
jgi:hypothetical protein